MALAESRSRSTWRTATLASSSTFWKRSTDRLTTRLLTLMEQAENNGISSSEMMTTSEWEIFNLELISVVQKKGFRWNYLPPTFTVYMPSVIHDVITEFMTTNSRRIDMHPGCVFMGSCNIVLQPRSESEIPEYKVPDYCIRGHDKITVVFEVGFSDTLTVLEENAKRTLQRNADVHLVILVDIQEQPKWNFQQSLWTGSHESQDHGPTFLSGWQVTGKISCDMMSYKMTANRKRLIQVEKPTTVIALDDYSPVADTFPIPYSLIFAGNPPTGFERQSLNLDLNIYRESLKTGVVMEGQRRYDMNARKISKFDQERGATPASS